MELVPYATPDLVTEVIDLANEDEPFRAQLFADPVSIFAKHGYEIPPKYRDEFNEFFREKFSWLTPHLGSGKSLDDLKNLEGFWCGVCQVGMWVIGATIVSIGAAALSQLTVASPIVFTLARAASYFVSSITAPAVLEFVKTLGTAIAIGIARVVVSICEWVGAC